MKISTVASARENVLDAVRSLGKGVFEVLLWVGLLTAESSDVGTESGLDLAGELAEGLLIEDENVVGFRFGVDAVAEGGVDFAGLVEEFVNPGLSSNNSGIGSGCVVVHQVDKSFHVLADLVQSLFGISSGSSSDEEGGDLHVFKMSKKNYCLLDLILCWFHKMMVNGTFSTLL
jgi:hypothetical protein